MSTDKRENDLSGSEKHDRALGRWENEGGRGASRASNTTTSVAGDIGDVETGHLRSRLIALENIVLALLAGAPESRSELVLEMADHISPRPSFTQHRMTIEAAGQMRALVDRAAHYKTDGT
ncbi:MAG: hypothetical protein ABI667_07035 [Sphingomicrobium sp.]